MEISTICKIPMNTEISSNTPGNRQSKTALHTTSAEKNPHQFHSNTSYLNTVFHVYFLPILFKPQYQERIRRELDKSFVMPLSAFRTGAFLCHANTALLFSQILGYSTFNFFFFFFLPGSL